MTTTDNKQAAEMAEKSSVCIIIETSKFNVRRAVPRSAVRVDSVQDGGAPDKAMLAVGKDLVDSDELRAIESYDASTKAWLGSRAVPDELLRNSAFRVSVDALADVYEYLERRSKDRKPLVKVFRAAYPGLVKAARERLGALWSPAQYPDVALIEQAFSFSWRVVEIGVPGEKLRSVSRALFEKEREKAESAWSNAVGQINEALAKGMAQVVGHLAEKLGGGDERPKRLRESAVKHVAEFLDTFDQRNLTKNADLADLVDKARKLLSGVDAKMLRGDAAVRGAVARGFADVKAGLDKMLEDRPARAITFSDEEV